MAQATAPILDSTPGMVLRPMHVFASRQDVLEVTNPGRRIVAAVVLVGYRQAEHSLQVRMQDHRGGVLLRPQLAQPDLVEDRVGVDLLDRHRADWLAHVFSDI